MHSLQCRCLPYQSVTGLGHGMDPNGRASANPPPHARSGMMDAGHGTWVFPVLELIKAGAPRRGNARAA